MNPRTLLYNTQIAELIDAVRPPPKVEKQTLPGLLPTFERIHADSAQTIALINKYGPIQLDPPEAPFDLGPAALMALAAFIVCILIHQSTGRRLL